MLFPVSLSVSGLSPVCLLMRDDDAKHSTIIFWGGKEEKEGSPFGQLASSEQSSFIDFLF